MKILQEPGFMKKFRRSSWKAQETFETPLTDLKNFLSAVSGTLLIHGGRLVIDSWIAEPRELLKILETNGLPTEVSRDTVIVADSTDDALALLLVALRCPLDFVFLPQPQAFSIYADHDHVLRAKPRRSQSCYGIA